MITDRRERSPIGYPTAAEFAYESLRDWIVTGSVTPGERVELGDVASRLGLSTTPVRQALQRLDCEGLMVLEPHRGAVVRELSTPELLEVYALRRRLEGWAVETACERLDDADRREIGARFEALDRAGPESFASANRTFHFRIFEAARQPLLHRFLTVLWDLSERHRHEHLRRAELLEASRREHRALWDLVRGGRGREAADLVLVHIERTKELVLHERGR